MELPTYLSSGEVARLIPVAADGKREARATSILMATLSAVPAFNSVMLASLGQRTGARAKLACFTEVVLRDETSGPKSRPDGLLVLDGGRGRTWSCLIEAKVGNAELESEQVERYLSLARSNGIDAVLTISNQFVALATHSPAKIAKSALKGVQLYHWSWMNVLTQALLLLDDDRFERPEQAYILAEMTRYFSHPSIGVSTFDRMNPEWKDLVGKIQAGAGVSKSDPMVENTIASWHQESRDLCLMMARKLFRHVRLKLPRAHAEDPVLRLRADCEKLARDHKMEFTLEIPDAAAPLVVVADLLRRSVSVSMTLAAPSDKQRASSRIAWLVRQLSKAKSENIHVKAAWPGRAADTQAELAALLANPAILEPDNKALAPSSFEVMLVRDLAGKFAGTKTFLEQLEEALPQFYEQVGQHVRAYVAPPPRIAQAKGEEGDGLEGEKDAVAEIGARAEVSTTEALEDLDDLPVTPGTPDSDSSTIPDRSEP